MLRSNQAFIERRKDRLQAAKRARLRNEFKILNEEMRAELLSLKRCGIDLVEFFSIIVDATKAGIDVNALLKGAIGLPVKQG